MLCGRHARDYLATWLALTTCSAGPAPSPRWCHVAAGQPPRRTRLQPPGCTQLTVLFLPHNKHRRPASRCGVRAAGDAPSGRRLHGTPFGMQLCPALLHHT
ncbi:hypothetical protein E2C01_070356 [Portunus trituberculatus]|uniref:Uncharacterized protein n=1 Tax=Portunus trituberculatus TaxID=210409 RepID=A0A5B7I1C8_PORTR|nr:hypothetical protein [Portunus trituberculatus]